MLRVPDPDDDVTGAEMEVWVVGDVVDTNVLLRAENLDRKVEKSTEGLSWSEEPSAQAGFRD